MFYTPKQAIEALEQILQQAESDELTEQPVKAETLHLLRQALYAVQEEEAIEEAINENRSDLRFHTASY